MPFESTREVANKYYFDENYKFNAFSHQILCSEFMLWHYFRTLTNQVKKLWNLENLSDNYSMENTACQNLRDNFFYDSWNK